MDARLLLYVQLLADGIYLLFPRTVLGSGRENPTAYQHRLRHSSYCSLLCARYPYDDLFTEDYRVDTADRYGCCAPFGNRFLSPSAGRYPVL